MDWKKFKFINKEKNSDLIVKRNWKKIGIWSTVGAVVVAGLVPAIYFPIVLNRPHAEPLPSIIKKVNENSLLDVFEKESKGDEIWGVFIDIADNNESDFALYGKEDEDGNYNKSKFEGPFGDYVTGGSSTVGENWYSFHDVDSMDATDMLAKFIFNAYKNDDDAIVAGESYYLVSILDEDTDWDEVSNDDSKQQYINVNHNDIDSNGNEDDSYKLSYGIDGAVTSISGPMWLTFKGDDLVFIVDGISQDDAKWTQAEHFEKLIDETESTGK